MATNAASLQDKIERQGKKPAPDSRNREFEVGLLRSFDGKLVIQSGVTGNGSVGPGLGRVGRRAGSKWWKGHDLYSLARKAQAVLDAPGESR